MKKLLFCNLDLLKVSFTGEEYTKCDFTRFNPHLIGEIRDGFVSVLCELSRTDSNKVFFYSRNAATLNKAKSRYDSIAEFNFLSRDDVKKLAEDHRDKNNFFVFIGTKDMDFFTAVNSKSLFIVPCWLPIEEKAFRYGIKVETPSQFSKFIRTLNNQNAWYSKIEIDNITTAYSLIDARYIYHANSDSEREMVENFQRLLKNDLSPSYHNILLYHFLAGMTNVKDFDGIELFGMIPSSNCRLNPYVYEFMTQVRIVKGKRLPRNYGEEVPIEKQNLLIRHTAKTQNHNGGRNWQQRLGLGADDEFATLLVNPDYKARMDKLREQEKLNICIFDDYMTFGNSFNAVRNMLEKIGANRIIFVSIGYFGNAFQYREYRIDGDVYTAIFGYEEIESAQLNGYEINEDAKEEVSALRDIFGA